MTCVLLPLLITATCANAVGQPTIQVAPTGVIEEVRLGGELFAGTDQSWRVTGTFPGGGHPIEFQEEIIQARDSLQIHCRLVPSSDIKTAGPFLILQLPCDIHAGNSHWYRGSGPLVATREFPAQLPPKYHLDYGQHSR